MGRFLSCVMSDGKGLGLSGVHLWVFCGGLTVDGVSIVTFSI